MVKANALATATCGVAKSQDKPAAPAMAPSTPRPPSASCTRSRTVNVVPAHSVPAGITTAPSTTGPQWVEVRFATTIALMYAASTSTLTVYCGLPAAC